MERSLCLIRTQQGLDIAFNWGIAKEPVESQRPRHQNEKNDQF
jgi:hypothetical protein